MLDRDFPACLPIGSHTCTDFCIYLLSYASCFFVGFFFFLYYCDKEKLFLRSGGGGGQCKIQRTRI